MVHAHAAHEAGSPLAPFDYEIDRLDPHQILVRVAACGLCHSDLHMIDDDWGVSRYPLVPGHEVVGEVVEVGGEVSHVAVGDRVGIGWQRSACLECDDCLAGDENLCRESTSVIGHGYGGFADHLVVDSRFAFHLPDGLDTLDAGPLMCGGITVYSALRYAGLRGGQHVGVIGVGGLGHIAVQFAAKLGSLVTVFTTSDDKAEFAAELGAHDAIVSRELAPPRAPSRPLDILLNTAPVPFDWNAYLQTLATDGTLTLVANPGEPLSIDAGQLMFKRRRVMGSIIGGRAMMREMLQVAADQGVRPVIETFEMSQVNEAIQKVRDNTIRYRAVLKA